MSEKFQSFMTELLDTLDPFKDVISNVMVRDKDGEIQAAAKSKDGVISIEITCKGDLPGFNDKACFGSLPFLRGALASPKMEGGTVELTFGDASTGKDTVLRSVLLKGKNRYNVFYHANWKMSSRSLLVLGARALTLYISSNVSTNSLSIANATGQSNTGGSLMRFILLTNGSMAW